MKALYVSYHFLDALFFSTHGILLGTMCVCANPSSNSSLYIHVTFLRYTQVSPGDSLPQWTACLARRLEEEEEGYIHTGRRRRRRRP